MLQREIINKERRAFDLERGLVQKQAENQRMKEERDKVLEISSNLRAELNRAKRSVLEYKRIAETTQQDFKSPSTKAVNYEGVHMFSSGHMMERSDAVIREEANESMSDTAREGMVSFR